MSLLKRLNEKNVTISSTSSKQQQRKETIRPKENELKVSLRNHLITELKNHNNLDEEQQLQLLNKEAMEFLNENGERLTFEAKKTLVEDVANELTGYGPITPLLNDPSVSEVMVNGPDEIYVEKSGRLIKTPSYFRDDDHILQVIEKIVAPLGRRIDESSPMVDARLPDGSRVNAIIPPLALNGPTITIRKFPTDRLQVEDLIRFGTLSRAMAQFLQGCVKARLNVFISGGTGSGKTTLLNVLSSFIPTDERIITIEDAAELQLSQDHVISLETRPPNIEGRGAITIRDLVRNSLRMRPDRIIIGEVRSAEALDMLQAMNTGHDGSLATGHANSPRDMIARLETMVLMAGMDLPVRAIREQIAGAIDLIIQQTRLKDGSRKITHVTEVVGMEGETITLQDIFSFKQTGTNEDGKIEGKFVSTGIRPRAAEILENYGIDVPKDWFAEEW
ncbi:CpaF family protein [Salirhabdus salicampi]|uniref:CpaF family protein n=1 Tax=Salirhabdus salicampi TaxID=476102 RepID=UPI0020C1C181|nr:CpaF family protein [Salirhabdus salicampi]MCP8616135.1 CpaF family protein [Salirhabdus salicampi]